MVALIVYIGSLLTLTAQTYTKLRLNNESAHDGRSCSLYRVLTLTLRPRRSHLNDESTPDGRTYSLYRVLTLTAQTYMESLLNDGSAPDGHSYNLYRVLILTAKSTQTLLKDESPDNSYFHQTIGLTTKRSCSFIEMYHPAGKLRQLSTPRPNSHSLGSNVIRQSSHSDDCRLCVLTHFLGSNAVRQMQQVVQTRRKSRTQN